MPAQSDIASDPRTIARNVSGIFDATFPQLAPAIVAHFNRSYSRQIGGVIPVTTNVLDQSDLQRAMLFELSISAAEQLLDDAGAINWAQCLQEAGEKQRRYFDAQVPTSLGANDMAVAEQVAQNLIAGLSEIAQKDQQPVEPAPHIPGFRWISSGAGDFATDQTIIEVKCSSKPFSTADYRQIVIYWLLKQIQAVENGLSYWRVGVLLNPRSGRLVEFSFDELINLIAPHHAGGAVLDVFRSIITETNLTAHDENEFERQTWPNA
ncbi:hypothetical protein EQG41_20110 [Billgrantia azerbaijanica]|nr:hypothetical protein EQG41_20110 [Halomonas azerbaijanica]